MHCRVPVHGVARLEQAAREARSPWRREPSEAARGRLAVFDATCVTARRNHRIVLMAVIVAVGTNADGRREGLGTDIDPSEAETFWTERLTQAQATRPARRETRRLPRPRRQFLRPKPAQAES